MVKINEPNYKEWNWTFLSNSENLYLVQFFALQIYVRCLNLKLNIINWINFPLQNEPIFKS